MRDTDQKKAILDGLIGLFGQYRRWLVFIGTGTSVALHEGLGMPALRDHLQREMSPADEGWAAVQARLDGNQGLEQALTDLSLPPATKLRIERLTGDYIAKCDAEVRDAILLGEEKTWVGERLLRCLVQRLPPSSPRLRVVTPNYDMLIEYACAKSGIRYTTGYAGELLREWNWQQAQDGLTRNQETSQRGRRVVNSMLIPRVELLKVHGSINLFRDREGHRLFECDVWAANPPDGYAREIAAPGELKYKACAHNADPAAVARAAEDQAAAFLMIGYGFSDAHLHDRVLGRVHRSGCPLVVLTKDLEPDRVEMLRRHGTQVWILTADENRSENRTANHTRVFCPLSDEPMFLDGESLWNCQSFAERILGG